MLKDKTGTFVDAIIVLRLKTFHSPLVVPIICLNLNAKETNANEYHLLPLAIRELLKKLEKLKGSIIMQLNIIRKDK